MSYFESKARDDGTTFIAMRDDVPEWVSDAVFEAHDGELPNDWRFDICDSIFDALSDDIDADEHEIADELVDVYNSDRLAWLSSNQSRVAYCDDAREEFGSGDDDLLAQIGMGQYHCISQMVAVIREAITDNADEEDEEDIA
jgi:hypothetical protein